jgi:hypothetical protein
VSHGRWCEIYVRLNNHHVLCCCHSCRAQRLWNHTIAHPHVSLGQVVTLGQAPLAHSIKGWPLWWTRLMVAFPTFGIVNIQGHLILWWTGLQVGRSALSAVQYDCSLVTALRCSFVTQLTQLNFTSHVACKLVASFISSLYSLVAV